MRCGPRSGRRPASRSSTSRWTTSSARRTTPAAPARWPIRTRRSAPDGNALDTAVRLLAEAQRPVIMAGTNVWWGHAETALLNLAEALRIPVLMNGMARGTVPADHELGVLTRAVKSVGGGRCCAGDRGADGLPARLRRRVRSRDEADRRRPRRTRPAASTRGRGRALRRSDHHLVGAGTARADRSRGLDRRAARGRDRRAGGRAGRTRRRPHPAAPDAGVRRTQRAAGPRRDRRRSTQATSAPTPGG